MPTTMNDARNEAAKAVEATKDAAYHGKEAVKDAAIATKNAVTNAESETVARGREAVADAARTVRTRSAEARDAIADKAADARDAVADKTSRARHAVSDAAHDTKDAVEDAARDASNAVSRGVSSIGATISSAAAAVRDGVYNVLHTGKEVVVDAAERTKDAIGGAAERTKDAAENAAERTKDAAEDAAARTKNAAENAAARTRDAAEDTAARAKHATEDAAARTKNAAEDAAARTKNAAEDAASRTKNAAENAAARTRDAADDAAYRARGAASDAADRADATGARVASADYPRSGLLGAIYNATHTSPDTTVERVTTDGDRKVVTTTTTTTREIPIRTTLSDGRVVREDDRVYTPDGRVVGRYVDGRVIDDRTIDGRVVDFRRDELASVGDYPCNADIKLGDHDRLSGERVTTTTTREISDRGYDVRSTDRSYPDRTGVVEERRYDRTTDVSRNAPLVRPSAVDSTVNSAERAVNSAGQAVADAAQNAEAAVIGAAQSVRDTISHAVTSVRDAVYDATHTGGDVRVETREEAAERERRWSLLSEEDRAREIARRDAQVLQHKIDLRERNVDGLSEWERNHERRAYVPSEGTHRIDRSEYGHTGTRTIDVAADTEAERVRMLREAGRDVASHARTTAPTNTMALEADLEKKLDRTGRTIEIRGPDVRGAPLPAQHARTSAPTNSMALEADLEKKIDRDRTIEIRDRDYDSRDLREAMGATRDRDLVVDAERTIDRAAITSPMYSPGSTSRHNTTLASDSMDVRNNMQPMFENG